MDFFFVLSGFIIYHSSQGKSIGRYALARVRRVYLPYLPVGIGIALLYLFFPQLSADSREWSWLTTLTLIPIQAETALSVAWTLKHEILFYCIFAAIYFSGRLAIGLAIWASAIFAAALVGMEPNIPLALINLEFFFGIGAAIAYDRGWGHPAWYAFALMPFALWIWLGGQPADSVLMGLAFAALIVPTVRLERQGRIRVPYWLLLLGAASYAIYLVHSLAISVVARLAAGLLGSVILILGVIAGISAGLVYYWLVERPLLQALSVVAYRARVTAPREA